MWGNVLGGGVKQGKGLQIFKCEVCLKTQKGLEEMVNKWPEMVGKRFDRIEQQLTQIKESMSRVVEVVRLSDREGVRGKLDVTQGGAQESSGGVEGVQEEISQMVEEQRWQQQLKDWWPRQAQESGGAVLYREDGDKESTEEGGGVVNQGGLVNQEPAGARDNSGDLVEGKMEGKGGKEEVRAAGESWEPPTSWEQ